jgi:branched-chain amino acid transport system substrate-binding protein
MSLISRVVHGRQKARFITPVSLAILVALPFPSLTQAAQETVVKVAVVTSLTGNAAHLGKDEEDGARMAVDDINREGIALRDARVRLQLVPEDDADDPRTATTVAQRLVDEGVVAVVGHMNSGTSIPAARIYAQSDVVQISPSATNPTYTHQGFATTFRVVATDELQGPALAAYGARTLRLKSVAIIDDSTAYGAGLADQFEKAARQLGIRVLSRDAASGNTVDFHAVLTRIKAERPDALMFGGMDITGALLVRQAGSLSLGVPILAGDGVCEDDFPRLAGPAAAHVFCSIAGASPSHSPRGTEFGKQYQARFHHPVFGYAAFTYDAMHVVASAIARAGSADRKAILDAMPTTDYSGVTGRIRFDVHGDVNDPVISVYGYDSATKVLKDQIALATRG